MSEPTPDHHDDGVPPNATDDDAEPIGEPDPLLAAVRAIEDLPVGERAAAFERLNRSLVGALNELEQL